MYTSRFLSATASDATRPVMRKTLVSCQSDIPSLQYFVVSLLKEALETPS